MREQKQQFPGYGVVYPGGGARGIKVVRTFTQGAKKIHQPDGSVEYSIPPPTIHELFGGGFCYADGNPVTSREHLENISNPPMKERALKWFDSKQAAFAPGDIVDKDEVKKERPEPDYILSNEVPENVLLGEKGNGEVSPPDTLQNTLSEMAKAIGSIASGVNTLTDRVSTLENAPAQRKLVEGKKREKQRDAMRAKWKDPEYVKNVMASRTKTKEEVKEDERIPVDNPNEANSTG